MTAAENGNWYMVNRDGMATLCTDRADAEKEAADAQSVWPHMGPHRAVRLVEASFGAADMAAAAAQGVRDGVASVAANAGGEPVARAGAAVLCWVNEDELPEGLTQEAYSALFPHSKVDVVRMFPIFGPTAQAAPAGAGTWAHLKLMMEESAWDGTLQLSDALANIDDFAAAHPSPPEGMAVCSACDARLIAAAPDLLEALKELRGWYQEHIGLPARAANAAISKATGAKP